MPQGVEHHAQEQVGGELGGAWPGWRRHKGFYFSYPSGGRATGQRYRAFWDEAQRLQQIFAQGIRYSLILLNESLASTNPGESLYIAQDIVRILRLLGARAIFATHLHELVVNMATLNASTDGVSHIVRQVVSRMGIGENGLYRSYKIALAPR